LTSGKQDLIYSLRLGGPPLKFNVIGSEVVMGKKNLSVAERIAMSSATNRGGIHFVDGRYDVELVKTIHDESAQGKGEFVAAEFRILASNTEERPSGTYVSQVYMFHHGDVTFANLKMLCLAILGMTESEFAAALPTPEQQAAAIDHLIAGDGTNGAGALLRADANTIKTRAGTPFTKVIFEPLAEDAVGTAGPY
jgi:hypothetical protein